LAGRTAVIPDRLVVVLTAGICRKVEITLKGEAVTRITISAFRRDAFPSTTMWERLELAPDVIRGCGPV
jgi:hypothetical protein